MGLTNVRKLIKFPVIFIVISALLFGFFCVSMFDKSSMEMEVMNMPGMVSIKAEHECCGDTMSQHIQSWTNTFLTTSQDLRNNFALWALGLLVALVFTRSRFSFASIDQMPFSDRLYLQQYPNLIIFNPLKLAFARGILHPKLY